MIAEPEHWTEWGRYAVFREDEHCNLKFVRFREDCPDYIKEEINTFLSDMESMRRKMCGGELE